MAVLFTVLCGGTALILGYFIHFFAKGHLILGTEAVLDTEIKYIKTLSGDELLSIQSGPERLYWVFEGERERPKMLPQNLSLLTEGIILFDHPDTGRQMAAKIHTSENGQKILVATDIEETQNSFNFMKILGVMSIVFVFLVVLVSYLISIFVVRGTNQIANTAREIIKTGDLSRRVIVGNQWDDLSNMATVLNLLLGRVEQLMHGVRQVSDNIAHDLRTPLTRMRNHIADLKKNEECGDNAYGSLLEETDNILKTFNAILRISRIEAEQQKKDFTNINLGVVLRDVVSFYEPLFEEKNLSFESDIHDIEFFGDRDLLFQTFANLMDNAVKYSEDGKNIKVTAIQKDGQTKISIQDNGPGVHNGEEDKIFSRFYRSEKCRSTPGTGLGLSLVAAVIALHEGTISAENTHPGLRVVTIF